MGKGDVKTRRGKIFRGSHGKLRPRNKQKQQVIKPQDKKKK